jgi:tetratricopeptide (TPR) repeat protein
VTKKRRARPTADSTGDSHHDGRGANVPLPGSGAARHRRRTVLQALLGLALAGLVMAVFGQVRHHDFASLDDTAYVIENEHVARGLTASGLVWAVTAVDTGVGNWHPVTWVSHMVDVELFGMRAGSHHMVSVVLHAVNTLVLFLLLGSMTGHIWRSACVAALFAIHPLHVESVAWIAERKDVLSTLFWLLATWAYVRYASTPTRLRFTLVVVLFALGLMSKPMVVTLPFTLLLLDWWPLNRVASAETARGQVRSVSLRPWLPLVVEKWPLFLMSVLSGVLTVVAQRLGGAVVTLEAIPASTRLANAALSFGTYAWQTVWPSGLSVFYPYSGEVQAAATTAAVAFIVGGSIAAARSVRARRHVTFGWLWYVGTLVPVIGLVQVGMQARADRYTYVPLIGLFVAIVWECADRAGTRRVPRMAISMGACAVIAAFGVRARAQVAYWADDVTLWGQALEVHPDNYYAHFSLGRVDLQHGRRDAAMAHLERALELAPWFAEGHDAMGLAYARGGQFDAAIAKHLEALRRQPGLLAARFNLGLAYEQRGDSDLAVQQYREAIRRAPRKAAFRAALAHVLATQGQLDAATEAATEALRLNPDSAEARYVLGRVLASRGLHDQAIAELERALASKPAFAPAQSMLATLLLERGRVDEAIEHLRGAVRAEPSSAGARAALGSALAGHGRLDDAIPEYDEAVRLAPDDAELRHALGLCLARQGRIPDAVVQLSEAVRIRPDSDALHVSLGMALAASGDAQRGAAHFRAALRLNPRNPDAHAGLQALAREAGAR